MRVPQPMSYEHPTVAQDAMDAVAERVWDSDGGVECPDCPGQVLIIIEADADSKGLMSRCPVHGWFRVDVTEEFDEEHRLRMEDERDARWI